MVIDISFRLSDIAINHPAAKAIDHNVITSVCETIAGSLLLV